MNPWSDVFLGIIAVATLAIAISHIAVLVAAVGLARRMARLADDFEREMKPLFGHLDAIGRDAARAAALGTLQVERVDRVLADVAGRIEQALDNVQTTLGKPVSQGRALFSAFKAAIQAVRELRRSSRARQARGDDEDALFI